MTAIASLRRVRRLLSAASTFLTRPASAAILAGLGALALLGGLPGELASPCAPGLQLEQVAEIARKRRPELSEAQVRRIADRHGPAWCVPPKLGKSYAARALETRRPAAVDDGVTPQAYSRAIEQKNAMITGKAGASVPNASGTWEPYGRGPLIVNDLRYGRVNGLGLVYNSGRVDSMDHDPVNNRLFATIGTGGVWMSTATTVEALGDEWISIGDTLPNQSVGAVAWTSAGGGTLIVGGGEPLFLGGGAYDGLGAYWSSDLGATWTRATGPIPEGILTFQVAVDKANPQMVYLATSKGLFRSTDAGRSFVNVNLPVSAPGSNPDCTGYTGIDNECFYANVVTDVVVKAPGGVPAVTCPATGCPVVAAVGYQRSNAMTYQNGKVLAPGNGLYRSDSGAPGTFTKLPMGNGLSNVGLPPQDRFGRTELDAAWGATQNHNYLYAIVQDAQLMAGGLRGIDVPTEGSGVVPTTTYFNGLYISPDFGTTWIRAADTAEVANNPNSNSAFVAAQALISPGIQAWYNLWIKVDPTGASTAPTSAGAPMRVLFGLEEVWQSRFNGLPQDGVSQSGNNDYKVVGTYFAGTSCQFPLGVGGDALCPTRDPDAATGYITTTHPDQHEGLFIPRTNGGVCAFVGNDGGVYRQCIDAGAPEFQQSQWGDGVNKGFYTLLPYHMAVAKDGTVWFGLQDNGSGKIDTRTRRTYETIGGDGFFVAVDPNNSQIAYSERPAAALAVTIDGGVTWTDILPPAAVTDTAPFSTPFAMDPLDSDHLIIAGQAIAEALDGPDGTWEVVFDMGTNPDNAEARVQTALDVHGDAAYVGACGNCNRSVRVDLGFQRWLATNVGGTEPPEKGTTKGWRFAAAAGLPQRYITGVEIDANDPATVYVTLGGYGGAQYLPPGRYLDPNTQIGTGNVFKSTDAGETFTNITGNLPELPMLWVTQLGTQLMVGTDIGAFISTDLNGTEWAPMGGTTLPATPVTSLHPHPGNPDLILASTFGRSIWCYSISGDPEACDPLPILEAPVQGAPTNVETPAASCDTDSNGAFTLNFTYTPLDPADALPDNFVVQEATEFDDVFDDNADEQLSGGENARWRVGGGSLTGADGWRSQVNPTTGSMSYYVPDTADQNWTLEMKDPVLLSSGGGTLSFETTMDTESCCDFGAVELSTDDFATFTTLATYSGDVVDGDFFAGERQIDLSAYGGQSIKLRFRMTSDANLGFTGWYVEDIRINTNNFAQVAELPGNATSHPLAGATDGTRYYRIGATATVGAATVAGPFSNVRCVAVALPNVLPVIDAGTGFTLDEGAAGGLVGTASDADGDTLTITWTQEAGPAVSGFTGTNTLTPSFTAPAVDADTLLTFKLTVSDGKGAPVTDTVDVTVHDLIVPPVTGGGAIGNNNVGGALPWLSLLVLAGAGLRRRRFLHG